MTMESVLLNDFYALNMRIAERGVWWTQGQGSNVSVKDADKLWIKASGFRLDEVNQSQGVACLELGANKLKVLNLLQNALSEEVKEMQYAELLKEAPLDSFCSRLRPSMESGFHLLIPSTFVAHFHSLVGILLCALYQSREGAAAAMSCVRAAGYQSSPLIIPQVKPGLALAEFFKSGTEHDLILIENHGVILHGADAVVMLEKWMVLEKNLIEEKLIQLPVLPADNAALLLSSLEPIFPDFAVFIDRIAKFVKPVDREGTLFWQADNALFSQRNFLELWHAQWLLENSSVAVSRFDKGICSALGTMPTEAFRRGAGDL